MKKSLLIALVALCAASTAFAVGGSIGIFTNATALDCALTQPAQFTTAQYTIVHTGTSGATGSGASAPIPPCAGGMIITDIPLVSVYLPADPTPGAVPSQVGFSAGYGSCRVSPIAISNMFYQALSPVAGCCSWSVVANPALGVPGPISTDCSTPIQEEGAAGGTAIISTNPALCGCQVDTHESTWGGVKELFRKGI
jgi:hypothetical protein